MPTPPPPSPPPLPPAGWYPDPNTPEMLQHWDGNRWTGHTRPAAITPPPPLLPPAAHRPPSPSVLRAPPQPPLAGPVLAQPTRSSSGTGKWWFIGGAGALVFVILVGSALANAGGRQGEDSAAQAAASSAPTSDPLDASSPPAEAPAPPPSTPRPEPTTIPADFKTEANSHIDDINKDLDDLTVTLDQSGFWRLLSNSVELTFNIAQLRILEPPATIAGEWVAALDAADGTVSTISEQAANEDTAGLRISVETLRTQVEALRGIANRAA